MISKLLKPIILSMLTVTIGLPVISFAAKKGNEQLRIQAGIPKRTDKAIFSSLIAWRQEGGVKNKVKGLAFINGSHAKNTITERATAKIMAKSLRAGIHYEAPGSRGAIVEYVNNATDLTISNLVGFDLTRIVIGDYTNQKLQYSVPQKSFSTAGIDIAIDLVHSAAVELTKTTSEVIPQSTDGSVTITIDNHAPVTIQTKGKNTEQLESELSTALGAIAKFSSEPIYPNIVALNSKSYTPFDKGEIQLFGLSEKSITIDINDSNLGVLTKFKFPAINKAEDNFENSMIKLLSLLLITSLGYVFYIRKKS